MPSLETHIQLSVERTGKGFREVHEWLDGKSLVTAERIERHSKANIQKFLPAIEEKFGKDGAKEYLQHLKDDFDKSVLLSVLERIRNALKRVE